MCYLYPSKRKPTISAPLNQLTWSLYSNLRWLQYQNLKYFTELEIFSHFWILYTFNKPLQSHWFPLISLKYNISGWKSTNCAETVRVCLESPMNWNTRNDENVVFNHRLSNRKFTRNMMMYFSTYENPLYSTSDLHKIHYTHIQPTSTWFYSCYMDLWPQRPAP